NRELRWEQIREWAEYVRTHPDEEWGRQVNTLVNAQLQAARRAQSLVEDDPEDAADESDWEADGDNSA
ncbi:MAG: hypothetical protein ABEH35_04520, partial [Haloarculaceae archaeon]